MAALGIIEGCLMIKEIENYDKAGLIKNLEEVREILIKEVRKCKRLGI